MAEFEVFKITPEVGNLCYEYAESTRSEGRWPSQRHFTNSVPLYVGRLTRFETGGYRDNSWRRDFYEDNNGLEHVVNYSYAGTTCFRVVPCLPHDVRNAESLATLVHTGKTNRYIAHSINNFLSNKHNPYLDNGIFYKDDGKGQKSRRKRVKKLRRRKSRGQKY
jgi:hypothetical protein